MKVLIADDDDLALKILRRYLEQWGHEVVQAMNGAEAWDLFQKDEYPIVISDWMMPKMDGLELIRRIRSQESRAYVYTILITARTDKDDLVKGMEAGADDFVSKPFDRDELRVRLREGERIIDLERALAEAESSREKRLRSLIAQAVEEAEKDLETATATLDAIDGDGRSEMHEKLVEVLGHLKHARDALKLLRDA